LTENDHFYFIRPILANEVNWPLSAYLYGDVNFDPQKPHTGVDIVVDEGTPVVAAGPGTVVWAGYGLFLGGQDDSDPYGKAIAIRHDYGYKDQQLYTIYAHNSQLYVVRGQHVEAGQLIAASGNTGLTTAAHLHFEVRMGLNYFYDSYNPILWMSPPQGWGVLVGRVTTTWGDLVDGLQIRVTNVTTLDHKIGKSYGTDKTINPDPYYKENFVMGDLPAGTYEIMVPYFGAYFRMTIQIWPGAITYFNFNGFNGFNTNPPPMEIPGNLPIIAP
jgi:murein DD-endopeptidase MepM/ murein hydrolase activator NlpD